MNPLFNALPTTVEETEEQKRRRLALGLPPQRHETPEIAMPPELAGFGQPDASMIRPVEDPELDFTLTPPPPPAPVFNDADPDTNRRIQQLQYASEPEPVPDRAAALTSNPQTWSMADEQARARLRNQWQAEGNRVPTDAELTAANPPVSRLSLGAADMIQPAPAAVAGPEPNPVRDVQDRWFGTPERRAQTTVDWYSDPANARAENKVDPTTGKAGFWGRLKDALLGGLYAASQQSQMGTEGGWAGLARTLGAFGGGMAGGAINPAWNEQLAQDQKVAQAKGVLAESADRQMQQLKLRQVGLDMVGKEIGNRKGLQELQWSGAAKAALDMADRKKEMTPELAAIIERETGVKFPVGYWGGIETMTDPKTGRLLGRKAAGGTIAAPIGGVNPSGAAQEREVDVGGLKLTLPSTDLGKMVAEQGRRNIEEQRNVRDQNAKGAFETSKANAAAYQSYATMAATRMQEAMKNATSEAGATGEARAMADRMGNIAAQTAAIAAELQQVDPLVEPKRAEALQKQLDAQIKTANDLQNEFGKVIRSREDLRGVGAALAASPIPPPPVLSWTPVKPIEDTTVAPVNDGSVISMAGLRKYAKQKKMSLEAALEEARISGVTVTP